MGSLSNIALTVGTAEKKTTQVADVITFTEAPWGLNQKLYPVQRVILKAHYGLELDDNPYGFDLAQPVPEDHPEYDDITLKTGQWKGLYKWVVPISDWRRERERYLSEADYLRYLYDSGRCNIREVVPGQELRVMVLSVGRRSGKCVVGDTLIPTSQGVLYLGDLVDPEGEEFQKCPEGLVVAQEGQKQAEPSYLYNGGIKPTTRIETRCGYALEGTDNHRIQVMGSSGVIEWRYLGDIQEGDQVALHRGSDLWSTEYVRVPKTVDCSDRLPDVVDENLGCFLGILTGDGHWTCKTSVEVTVGDEEFKPQLRERFTQLFREPSWHPDKRTLTTGRMSIHDRRTRRVLHELGFSWDCSVDTKRIPWSILQSPRSVVTAFLSGLFETDGGVEVHGKVVSFSSASEDLARGVQTLLLNLGIVSRVRGKPINGKIYYVLTIRGLRSRKLFASGIGFLTHRKQGPLIHSFGNREGGNTETIPHQRDRCRALVASVPKALPGHGWSRSAVRSLLGNTIKPSVPDELTRDRLEKVLATVEPSSLLEEGSEILGHLHNLHGLDFFYDPVQIVDRDREAPVFDFHVPDGHAFVGNGFVNHNTQMASIISAYETYKLILKEDPQSYYGLPVGEPIQLVSVATDKEQAGILYSKVAGYYKECGFFGAYAANNTMSYARFQTPSDIERYGRWSDNEKANATIRVTFRPCRAKGLRGAGNLVAILDEMAHFTDSGQSSADQVYNAIKPSLSAFSQKDPDDATFPIGDVEGRMICISSPLGRQGMFYKLFQLSMAGAPNMLAIQAPTWEVNPTVPVDEFEQNYRADPTVFFTEYGGEFTDRTRGWIETPQDLIDCVDRARRPASRALAKQSHFVGIDFALAGDGSAIAIGHLEGGVIVLDLVEWIKAGVGKYEHCDRLEFDDVADWVFDLSKRFLFQKGIFDQWSGIPFEQALHKKGLKMLESIHFTDPLSSQLFRNFKNMMWDKRLLLYDWPKPDPSDTTAGDHCPYISEILSLQAEYKSKYVTKVRAPNIKGRHDDMSDALVRMVWCASQNLAKPLHISGARNRSKSKNSVNPVQQHQARLRALRPGGSSPDRQPSRLMRGSIKGR